MTEAEWLACVDPRAMLEFLRDKASQRKLLLFAAAAFRRLAFLLPNERQRQAIEMLEQIAAGTATPAAHREAVTGARHAIPLASIASEGPARNDPYLVALMLYRAVNSPRWVAGHAVQAVAGLADGVPELKQQSCLLRDIFGPLPFRPVAIDPAWLAWNHGTVPAIARRIYDERRFEDLPILADALEDAGCTTAEILAHCRGPGPHVRGCWAVDLLLGKS